MSTAPTVSAIVYCDGIETRAVRTLEALSRQTLAGMEIVLVGAAPSEESARRDVPGLEAMRSGLAIVCTDVGGVSEAIIDDVTGLLVPPGSTSALSKAIGLLLDDPGLRLRLGRAARARFESQFSQDAMRAKAVEVFQRSGLT